MDGNDEEEVFDYVMPRESIPNINKEEKALLGSNTGTPIQKSGNNVKMHEGLSIGGVPILNDCDCARCMTAEFPNSTFPLEHTFIYTMPYICTQCGKGCIDENNLSTTHFKGIYLYRCFKCKLKFPTKASFEKHVLSDLEQENLHHQKENRQNSVFQCKECFIELASEIQLVIHSYIHLKCKDCGKKYKTNANLDHHYKTAHTFSFLYKLCSCTICLRKFSTQFGLEEHLKSHSEDSSIDCCKNSEKIAAEEFQECLRAKYFDLKNTERNYSVSQVYVNNNDNTVSAVETINKSMEFKIFGQNQSVSQAEMYDNMPASTPQSNQGSSDFVEKNNLDLQVKMNNDVALSTASAKHQSINCSNCKTKLAQWELTNHGCIVLEKLIKMDEESQSQYLKKFLVPCNGVKLYKCFVCAETFYYTVTSFKIHLYTHLETNEYIPSVKSDKMYECEQCKNKYTSVRLLKQHIRYHPYKFGSSFLCQKCGKTNSSVTSYRFHLMQCLNVQFYMCKSCCTIFDLEKELKCHLSASNCSSVGFYEKSNQPSTPKNIHQPIKTYTKKKF